MAVQLFKNRFLEKTTHVHPALPLLVWGPVSLVIFSKALESASWTLALGISSLGLFFWTLAEYLLHRFVFHLKPIGPKTKRLQYLIHGVHHDEPNVKTRLLMPLLPAAILAVFFYSFFSTILPRPINQLFFSGFIWGYLLYDYTHYALHHFNPKTEFGKRLKKHHMQHHFVHEKPAKWGVSTRFWDIVFRTQ